MQVNPRECKLLITDPPLNSERNREKMLEILFEELQFEHILIQPQAVLALYSQGTLNPATAIVPCAATSNGCGHTMSSIARAHALSSVACARAVCMQNTDNVLQFSHMDGILQASRLASWLTRAQQPRTLCPCSKGTLTRTRSSAFVSLGTT
jgi:hypothetical protein